MSFVCITNTSTSRPSPHFPFGASHVHVGCHHVLCVNSPIFVPARSSSTSILHVPVISVVLNTPKLTSPRARSNNPGTLFCIISRCCSTDNSPDAPVSATRDTSAFVTLCVSVRRVEMRRTVVVEYPRRCGDTDVVTSRGDSPNAEVTASDTSSSSALLCVPSVSIVPSNTKSTSVTCRYTLAATSVTGCRLYFTMAIASRTNATTVGSGPMNSLVNTHTACPPLLDAYSAPG